MNNMKKRLCSCMLFLCMLTAALACSLHTANAKENAKDDTGNTTYAAFGDSIAAGYGLAGYSDTQHDAPAGSYQALVADFLKTKSCNYAVSGDNSTDCIHLLHSGAADADLKHADVISLSIGSNDLLLPFIQIVMDYFDIDPDTMNQYVSDGSFQMPPLDMSSMMKYFQQSEALMNDLADNALLHAQADAFAEKFQEILSILREKAPASEIYVTNIYNPFHAVPKLGDLAETYIAQINQAFSADDPGYTLIDVHTPFSQKELTNVRFDLSHSDINPDPHPSAEGHQAIARLITAALTNAHAPKTASISSLTSSGRYKLTAKIKIPADADGYQVQYASSKKGTYKTLASASEKTYQTNSGKLKAGTTYYVKVRSYKKIKGVTYYGKSSAVKSVKIK